MITTHIDLSHYKWRKVEDDDSTRHYINHDYTILGYNRDAGALDMIVRWGSNGGHCNIHRHTARTTVFVLEGEQWLYDYDDDGKLLSEPRIRKAGEYGLSVGVERPHLERGGPQGGAALFTTHCTDSEGLLYEILDDDLNLLMPITIDTLVADFNESAK